MKAEEIREGDIVEIDYITEFTKEHINEGKALVIWKGFNNQPLVRKLDTKKAIWTCYEHIARVVGHIDIAGYMDRALSAEPCDDCISRQAVLDIVNNPLNIRLDAIIKALPPVTPKEKTGHWINAKVGKLFPSNDFKCSECGNLLDFDGVNCGRGDANYCPNCGCHMVEPQESEDKE